MYYYSCLLKTFVCLKNLALEGKVTVLVDGLDELGSFRTKDVSNACQAAANSTIEVDMKTAIAAI